MNLLKTREQRSSFIGISIIVIIFTFIFLLIYFLAGWMPLIWMALLGLGVIVFIVVLHALAFIFDKIGQWISDWINGGEV